MRTRLGFVSNSSSSSFILKTKECSKEILDIINELLNDKDVDSLFKLEQLSEYYDDSDITEILKDAVRCNYIDHLTMMNLLSLYNNKDKNVLYLSIPHGSMFYIVSDYSNPPKGMYPLGF